MLAADAPLDPKAAAVRPSDRRPALRGAPEAQRAWTRGVALVRQRRLAEALQQFGRAARISPAVSLYWLNHASTLRKLGRSGEAIASARRAFELDPSSEPACLLLAELLRLAHREDEALAALEGLDAEVDRSVEHSMLRGAALMALERWQDAAVAFLDVLASRPADIESYQQLGFALSKLARYGEAAECFRTIAVLEPAHLGAAIYAVHYAAWACDWRNGDEDLARLVGALGMRDETRGIAFSPFCILAMNDDAAMHRRVAAIEAARIAREVRRGSAAQRRTDHAEARAALARGRIRIGFVSADFRLHATSLLLVQTLERLDRRRFEVVLYSHGADDRSALRARLVAAADEFVDCTKMDIGAEAGRIRADGITLLIDLSGYTAGSRLGVFALRPAPVQALWLAYPSTTGSDFIDYVIGDPIVTPLEHAEDFSEKIAQLPLCYEPTDEQREHPAPSTRALHGLPADAFVFASFNQSYKITEEMFGRWCRILERVPHGVLWLLVPQAEIREALAARAAERGVDPQRLIFAPFVDQTAHLARLPLADLFLDTFPYGAHTTCSDALWMGLPVLTRIGRSFSARVAPSLLDAVGLSALVAADGEGYEAMAVRLAGSPAELAALRDHLRENRLSLPLFDNRRFTLELGALFERLVRHWESGAAPQPMAAERYAAESSCAC
jgi:predicted O-linked N-acetylglucosamine transferase (SPINDLY family)